MTQACATEHASAVLVGTRAVLIRGPSGSGKSRLALDLIDAARGGSLAFARLIGDDRVYLESINGRILVRPAPALAGLIEVRGAGLLGIAYEPSAVIGLVVDLGVADAVRLPDAPERQIGINGILLPRLAVPAGMAPLPAVMAHLTSPASAWLAGVRAGGRNGLVGI